MQTVEDKELILEVECDACDGDGQYFIGVPCRQCDGTGYKLTADGSKVLELVKRRLLRNVG
jgi:DnaJ-class molecular chaperone